MLFSQSDSHVMLAKGIRKNNYTELQWKQKREKKSKATYQYQESLDVDAITRYQARLILLGSCNTLFTQISSYIRVIHT